MEKGVVILAAGKGSKMFPFSTIRSKTTIKIAGKPLIRYNVESILSIGCKEIIVVTTNEHLRGIKDALSGLPYINYVVTDITQGTADSLEVGLSRLSNQLNFIVLYGDSIISMKDLERLYHSETPTILIGKLNESSKNWIAATTEEGNLKMIGAHYRGNNLTHQFVGFHLSSELFGYIQNTPDYFPDVKVGVAVPRERYIEAGLILALKSSCRIPVIECEDFYFDIDKPWHMLETNRFMVDYLCKNLTENILMDGAEISSKAILKGYVKLGKNSYIGDNVRVEGSLIIGDNTIIDNGAIFNGSAIIGNHTQIKNYCIIYDGASIGDNCILNHCSEFLGGLIMDKVYLYHYGEFYGAIGSYTDIGAATVCGTLRFDDGETSHSVKGRREVPLNFSNASYIGDYCRTGVNSMIMPGSKIGAYSVIGPGVLVEHDIEENSLVQLKQEIVIKKWNADKYGW